MSKLESIKRSVAKGGFKGIVRLGKDYYYRHFRGVRSQWPLNAVINSDMRGFEDKFGYTFDIYNPQSFTEKVHTYKLLYDDPSMSEIVDKYDFKSYVRRMLKNDKYTTEAYGVWSSTEEIRSAWNELPNSFVLKSTISSDGNNIIFINDKEQIEFDSIKADLDKCFLPENTQLNGFARAYYTLRPRVLAEKYMHELNGNDNLVDYKFYCFNGNVEFVYTTSRLFEDKENPSEADYPRTFFDLKWNKLDITLGDHPTADHLPKPPHFDEMIEISKKLSKGYPFVRIDFYDVTDNPLLGEMTFYPTGGMKPLKPLDFDRQLGDKFILPPDKLVRR